MADETLNYTIEHIAANAQRNNLQRKLLEPFIDLGISNCIHLNPSTWISSHDPHSENIEIGTQPMPKQVFEKVFYEVSNAAPKSSLDVLSYKLTHELTHKWLMMIWDEEPDLVGNLHRVLLAEREKGLGYTTFGSIDNAGKPLLQSYEDMKNYLQCIYGIRITLMII